MENLGKLLFLLLFVCVIAVTKVTAYAEEINACDIIFQKKIVGEIDGIEIELSFSPNATLGCSGEYLLDWKKPVVFDGNIFYEIGQEKGVYSAGSVFPVIWIDLNRKKYMLFIIHDVAYFFDDETMFHVKQL